MSFLNDYTLLAIGIYLLVIIGITYYSSRKEKAYDFLIASKKLGWKQIGFSTFATMISSYNIIIGITFAYLFGIYVFLVYAGAFMAFFVVYYMGKKVRNSSIDKRFTTVVDYFNFKYGKKVSTIINLILLFVLFFFITLQINVNTLVFSNLLSWGKIGAALFVTVVVLAYTYIGGFKTIVKTDIFQAILTFIIIVLAFMVGSSSITSSNVFDNLADTTILLGAFVLMLMQFLTLIVQPELWQRVYAAKSSKDLRRGLLFSSGLICLLVIPLIIIGMNVKYGGTVTDVGNAFYEILSFASPVWFFPIVAVGLFAAFMSTLDSSLFAMSSQLAKSGFVVGYKDEQNEKMIKRKMRIWMVIVLVGALILSLFLVDFLTSVFQLLSIAVVISTVFIMSFILKISKKEIFVALIVGVIAFIYASLGGIITQDPVTSLYPSIVLVGYIMVQRMFVLGYKKLRRKSIQFYSD